MWIMLKRWQLLEKAQTPKRQVQAVLGVVLPSQYACLSTRQRGQQRHFLIDDNERNHFAHLSIHQESLATFRIQSA